MSTVARIPTREPPGRVELRTGDRMTREEFHRAYLQTPEGFKAELIGGIVFVASPLSLHHGTPHAALGAALFTYAAATPGLECGDNVTILLGDEAEPQPDLFLRIRPEFGGQSHTSEDGYVSGPPELVAEISYTSRAIDLHLKRDDYRRYGVLEYLVVCVEEETVRWFDLRENQELAVSADNVLRSRCFPGLWVDCKALLAEDNARLLQIVQEGLATPEHAAFAERVGKAGSK